MAIGKPKIPELKPKERKTLPTFSERSEEALIKSLFEEQNQKEKEEATEQFLNEKTTVHKARPGEEWDVPIDEEIQYFDPELSYELTGYRPITMQKGLDFDPAPFRAAAIKYETTESYTEFPKGTKKYREFWSREVERCKNGYTVGRYRITGDNYFYLNFYRMDILKEGANGAEGRVESFPKFLSKQYE